MTVLCQFCRLLIQSSAVPDESSPASLAYAYRQLSMLVSAHMAHLHGYETAEITEAMALAGAAVAMRFVEASDARIDSLRIDAADRLRAALDPRPVAALPVLAESSEAP